MRIRRSSSCLRENGMLLFSERYEHRYPHCWRCKNPVIFRATPQWFISMDADVEKDETGRDVQLARRDGGARARARCARSSASVDPEWGADRMRNMLKGRPDWCVSRQRVWGVPIPCLLLPGVRRAGGRSRRSSITSPISSSGDGRRLVQRATESELLPEGYRARMRRRRVPKETDILDVWFDSGSSSVAVLESAGGPALARRRLPRRRRPVSRLVQLKLMVGLAAHDRAPYRYVITHGWDVDAQGKQMHKSAGNAISPNEVVKDSGAEILRLWAASSTTARICAARRRSCSRIRRLPQDTQHGALRARQPRRLRPGDRHGRAGRDAGDGPLGAGRTRRVIERALKGV
jgi:isoleucyl-tRNA synthetase